MHTDIYGYIHKIVAINPRRLLFFVYDMYEMSIYVFCIHIFTIHSYDIINLSYNTS